MFNFGQVTMIVLSVVTIIQIGLFTEMFKIEQLYLVPSLIRNKGQYYRLFVSPFILNVKDSHFLLIDLYGFLRFLKYIEDIKFRGNSQKMLYFLLWLLASIISLSYIFGILEPYEVMFGAVAYLWSKFNRNQQFLIVLFIVSAKYFLWVRIGLYMLLQQSILSDVLGIFIGHLFYFLLHIVPRLPQFKSININVFDPPQGFKKICSLLKITDQQQGLQPEFEDF